MSKPLRATGGRRPRPGARAAQRGINPADRGTARESPGRGRSFRAEIGRDRPGSPSSRTPLTLVTICDISRPKSWHGGSYTRRNVQPGTGPRAGGRRAAPSRLRPGSAVTGRRRAMASDGAGGVRGGGRVGPRGVLQEQLGRLGGRHHRRLRVGPTGQRDAAPRHDHLGGVARLLPHLDLPVDARAASSPGSTPPAPADASLTPG